VWIASGRDSARFATTGGGEARGGAREGSPAPDDETRLGFRASQDELYRVTELIEAERDLLTGAL
jgi:hypothetical protein